MAVRRNTKSILLGVQTVALAFILAGCVDGPDRADGLYFSPPTSTGQQTVKTASAPAEVAQALRDAGLGDARVIGDDIVWLMSQDPSLVDCGTVIQVAKGNQAEFPGNAPKAVLIEGFVTPGLIERDISSVSKVRLTRLPDESGYTVYEAHTVTRRFAALSSAARSTGSVSFDQTSEAAFSEGTSCRSSGLIKSLLR